MEIKQHYLTHILVPLAALVVVIAGMKLSKDIMVPFILSAFFAIILSSPMNWLQSKGLNKGLSLLGVMLFTLFIMSLIIMTVGGTVSEFEKQLPVYSEKITQLWQKIGADFNLDADKAKSLFNPERFVGYFSNFLSGLSSVFSQIFLIVFIVIFMLLEAASFDKKLSLINTESKAIVSKMVGSIRGYLGIKFIFCFATGICIWLLALVLDVPFPELWGLLAGLLNFIPNVGSIIAAIPAVVFALIQGGVETAAIFAAGIIAVNVILGNVLEPKYMGQGLGLSVLVVFLSLTFWGWVLGPMGMLLSVPLTMILKLLLEAKPETQYLAILLSSREGI